MQKTPVLTGVSVVFASEGSSMLEFYQRRNLKILPSRVTQVVVRPVR